MKHIAFLLLLKEAMRLDWCVDDMCEQCASAELRER